MKGLLAIVLLGISFIFFQSFQLEKKEKKLPGTEVELGKLLFFDPILSANKKTSCASCHKPEFAFADTLPFSIGFKGKPTQRNTPTAMNLMDRPYLFWDGRSPNLEDQALHPIRNSVEMGMTEKDLVTRLNKNKFYRLAFFKIYGKNPNTLLLGKAIAAFERTLETGDSPFDKFMNGDSNAISASAMRGRDAFLDKGHCFDCHFTPDFTADEFKNIGLFNGKELNDSGRFAVTKDPNDIGKFKVPGLRNIALTAPYMHNGKFKSLEAVIEYYNNPSAFVNNAIGRDSLLSQPIGFTDLEKADLLAFLKSLTTKKIQTF